MTGQRRVLLIQLSLMTLDETKMTSTMTIWMMKTTTMSLWNTHSLMHIHLYLPIVHSLSFTYPLRTLLATIHHMTLSMMSLYQIPLQPGKAQRTLQSLPMKYWGVLVMCAAWIGAGKTELDNLTDTGTVTRLSPEERAEIKRMARSNGQKYIELPAKAVFTIKPSKLRSG